MTRPASAVSALARVAVAAAAASLACRGFSDADAERLVRAYNRQLIEAYRTGDEQLMEGFVGDEEGKKLLGLIGVKRDMGITLDAELLEFKVLGVRRATGAVEVSTEERWRYRDRRIGSGAVVGEESRDHYFMCYTLNPSAATWVVSRVAFVRPPEVGRRQVTNQAPPPVFHGKEPPAADGRRGAPPQGRRP